MIGYTVIICAAGSELISKQNPDMEEAVKKFHFNDNVDSWWVRREFNLS
jgi:hypothetical protein